MLFFGVNPHGELSVSAVSAKMDDALPLRSAAVLVLSVSSSSNSDVFAREGASGSSPNKLIVCGSRMGGGGWVGGRSVQLQDLRLGCWERWNGVRLMLS